MDSVIHFFQYISHLNWQIRVYCIYVIDKMIYVILLIIEFSHFIYYICTCMIFL